jgi:hypothetical protein
MITKRMIWENISNPRKKNPATDCGEKSPLS